MGNEGHLNIYEEDMSYQNPMQSLFDNGNPSISYCGKPPIWGPIRTCTDMCAGEEAGITFAYADHDLNGPVMSLSSFSGRCCPPYQSHPCSPSSLNRRQK